MTRRAGIPVAVAALALAGSAGTSLFLFRAALTTLDQTLQARLRSAGRVTAALFAEVEPTSRRLRTVLEANALEGAYLVSPQLAIVADATGDTRPKLDLLRTDPEKVIAALGGQESVAQSYALGAVQVATGYFPVLGPDGSVRAVVALEAGTAFADAHQALHRAVVIAILLSLVTAIALGAIAAGWIFAERENRAAAARAARAEALGQMAAIAAHEIRNPLGVIRGTVELMRERLPVTAPQAEREALADVLVEVQRLRRLTDDFLDLAVDRPMVFEPIELRGFLAEAARASEAAAPALRVALELAEPLPEIEGDRHRLRQVLANLLANASEAQGEGAVTLGARFEGGRVRLRVRDRGPGVPADLRERVFDPLVTVKPGGTGLGLAIARRWVERHGGSLVLLDAPGPGAVFEIDLPVRRS